MSYALDEKLRVRDAVFLFQFVYELFSRISAPVSGNSCVEDDFRIHVKCGVKPRFLFTVELDLRFINGDTVWLGGELLLVVLGVGLVPVMNRGVASVDAEPLTEVSHSANEADPA